MTWLWKYSASHSWVIWAMWKRMMSCWNTSDHHLDPGLQFQCHQRHCFLVPTRKKWDGLTWLLLITIPRIITDNIKSVSSTLSHWLFLLFTWPLLRIRLSPNCCSWWLLLQSQFTFSYMKLEAANNYWHIWKRNGKVKIWHILCNITLDHLPFIACKNVFSNTLHTFGVLCAEKVPD